MDLGCSHEVVTQTRGDILVEGFEWGVLNAFLNLFCRVTGGSRWGYRESDSTVWVEEEGRVERRVVEQRGDGGIASFAL